MTSLKRFKVRDDEKCVSTSCEIIQRNNIFIIKQVGRFPYTAASRRESVLGKELSWTRKCQAGLVEYGNLGDGGLDDQDMSCYTDANHGAIRIPNP